MKKTLTDTIGMFDLLKVGQRAVAISHPDMTVDSARYVVVRGEKCQHDFMWESPYSTFIVNDHTLKYQWRIENAEKELTPTEAFHAILDGKKVKHVVENSPIKDYGHYSTGIFTMTDYPSFKRFKFGKWFLVEE